MEAKTVTVSEKGQIAIPVEVRRNAGINKGDVLILIQDGQHIMIKKVKTIAKTVSSDFLKLKQELNCWDELSDEALENFEAQL